MVSLEDIRKKYEDLAKLNAISLSKTYDGYPTRAYKTGTLYKSIRVLVTAKQAGRVVLDLAAVRYSVFLNSGFTHYRSGKFIRRPFATAATNDKEFKQVIDDYFLATQDEVVAKQLEIVTQKLAKYGLADKISPNSSTKRYSY